MADLTACLAQIDAAHSLDPTIINKTPPIPQELHYAHRMTHHLHLHTPNPSLELQTAVRAQHLRRWEVPRSTYPAGRTGYLKWRADLKVRQARLVREICVRCGYEEGQAERVAGLVRKEGLKVGVGVEGKREGDGSEVQVLEDVACLVFLEGELEGFVRRHVDGEAGGGEGGEGGGGGGKGDHGEGEGEGEDENMLGEEKVVGILRKTWAKMGERGREMVMLMAEEGKVGDRGKELLQKALEGKSGG